MALSLETSLQFVKGIGPRIAQTLQDKRITTVEDLLYHLPFRYEDRLRPQAIEELVPGEMASLIGEVRGMALLRTRRMPIFEMTVGQGLSKVKCMWFHGTYLKDRFKAGQWVALYGKVEASRSSNSFKMIQPQVEVLPDDHDDDESKLLEVGRIAPVYESLGNKLASRWQRRVIWRVLEELKGRIPETPPRSVLPSFAAAQPGRCTALRALPGARNPDEPTARLDHPGAEAVDLRRALLPRTRPGIEAEEISPATRHSLRDQ